MVEASDLDFSAGPEAAGVRLDRFLASATLAAGQSLSRTRLKALILGGHVRIGARAARDPAQKLAGAEVVTITLPPPEAAEPAAQDIPLDVVFEDDHLLVLDKPAGLVVHPAAGHADGTLVNALIAHCGDSLSGIGGVRRPGIVHRLDKDTSGLLVVAKTDSAHKGLSLLFADHGRTGSLQRRYLAFAWGPFGRPSGTIDAPLGRHPQHREKMGVARPGQGREARTHWRILADLGGEASLVACELETGRTHQIRVHLAHIGHPLLGDATYGLGFKTKISRLGASARDALETLDRQALHAATLGFIHPMTQEHLLFESELPADMRKLAEALREDRPD